MTPKPGKLRRALLLVFRTVLVVSALPWLIVVSATLVMRTLPTREENRVWYMPLNGQRAFYVSYTKCINVGFMTRSPGDAAAPWSTVSHPWLSAFDYAFWNDIDRMRGGRVFFGPGGADPVGRMGIAVEPYVAVARNSRDWETADQYLISAPVWVVLLVGGTWIASAVAFSFHLVPRLRAAQRRRQGLCGRCGYNLAHNVSGKCPECGDPVPARS